MLTVFIFKRANILLSNIIYGKCTLYIWIKSGLNSGTTKRFWFFFDSDSEVNIILKWLYLLNYKLFSHNFNILSNTSSNHIRFMGSLNTTAIVLISIFKIASFLRRLFKVPSSLPSPIIKECMLLIYTVFTNLGEEDFQKYFC